MVEKLNLDLYTEVINWNEMKDLQLSFFKSGVPHIDTPQDHAFFATMYKFANKHNIKSIVTEQIFLLSVSGILKNGCIFNLIIYKFWIFKKHGNIKLKDYPLTNIIWHKIWLPYFKGIKVYKLLDLMEYNKKEALETLETCYGFQPYPQKHFESRFTKFYESYWLYEKFGFDTRKVQFSSLILTNQMTREEALEQLMKKPYDQENIRHEFEYIAKKLGITVDELQSYFDLPNKTFKDFKKPRRYLQFWSMGNEACRIRARR